MSSVDSCFFCNNHCVYGLNKVKACATCAGSKPIWLHIPAVVEIANPNCTAEGLYSLSQDTWFSLVINVLFAWRWPSLYRFLLPGLSPWWKQFDQQSLNWSTAEAINLLSPFTLPQPGVRVLWTPSRGGVVVDDRHAKRGFSHWGVLLGDCVWAKKASGNQVVQRGAY